MKYVVNEVRADNFPHVPQSIGCETWAQAITIAVKMVMEHQSDDTKEQVENELETDGYYTPTKHSEWSICINELDNANEQPTINTTS